MVNFFQCTAFFNINCFLTYWTIFIIYFSIFLYWFFNYFTSVKIQQLVFRKTNTDKKRKPAQMRIQAWVGPFVPRFRLQFRCGPKQRLERQFSSLAPTDKHPGPSPMKTRFPAWLSLAASFLCLNKKVASFQQKFNQLTHTPWPLTENIGPLTVQALTIDFPWKQGSI